MTKHNAEMENSREQSRVCARLPLNLQLFAEDTGEAEADTDTEGAAGSTGAGLCDCRYGEKSSRLHFGSCKAFISVARILAENCIFSKKLVVGIDKYYSFVA